MNSVNPIAQQGAASAPKASSDNGGLPSSAGLNNMFLQLLVAQLHNQSPLNPMDPTQFVGQLAQFSELSEVTQIEQLLQNMASRGTSHIYPALNTPSEMRAAPGAEAIAPQSALVSNAASGAQAVAKSQSTSTPSTFNPKIQGVF